ncbi:MULTISPECIES: flagellar motor switch phosphatase FliY [unclassified Virgibacillus]|uniref:flagellar motor switch phosphatase FliY n=1 Tax=unclassified Virgibacillus TaxID=2620237 RepID=UPI0024DE805D|nr:flagellar motor switch phosphatase FliY [Virgibacillus sp. LDC-1]
MMDDGMLSQDEIDALLKVGDDDDTSLHSEEEYLTTIEKDTLGEIGNISFGSSATTLSTLLSQKVEITTPEVSIMTQTSIMEEFSIPHVSIRVNYTEGFTGSNLFIMKTEDAAIISDVMLGGDGQSPEEELNEIHLSAVQEAMNQMMGAAATSMSTVFKKKVDISPPSIQLNQKDDVKENEQIKEEEALVKVSFQLKVGTLVDSNIMQVMPIDFAKQLVEEITNQEEQAATIEMEREVDMNGQNNHTKPNVVATDQITGEPQFIGNPTNVQNASVQQAAFSNFDQVELAQNEQRNLDMLLDIQLKVTVELGRTRRSIKEILDMQAGSIVELDKLAGEPVDILVNDKLIAKGEVVVIDENFGVRLTDIASQSDRLKKLR